HEELYTWETREDVLGAITDIVQTDNLREALVDTFAPDKPAENRRIAALKIVIVMIDAILNNRESSDWGDVNEERSLVSGEKLHLRQHRLLAFQQHLQWIIDTFSLVPDVYVTIR
ncbi:MAG: hypothetical protein ACRYFS_18655, partial [Janthinobacterium lividum]